MLLFNGGGGHLIEDNRSMATRSKPCIWKAGIYAADRLNVTVRNCNVRGFFWGVTLISSTGGGGHIVEDNRFDGNTNIGIVVDGDGSVVRRNLVFDTGAGTTIIPDATGLVAYGSVDIIDNTISGVLPSGFGGADGPATGISVSAVDGSNISNNRISGLVQVAGGLSIGIRLTNSARVFLTGNHLAGDVSTGSIGLRCLDTAARAKDNVVSGFETNIQTCGDAGGNDSSP